jgi:dienelactone hydrolase/DNA-directed RNA polymerase subunit RPC12/RpoP
MAIDFQCGKCGRSYNVTDEWGGKRVKCKQCGSPINVPRGDASPPAELDVFGFAEMEREAPSVSTSASVLPPRGSASQEPVSPKLKAKKAAKSKSKENTGRPIMAFGGTAGTIFLIVLAVLRGYNRYEKSQARNTQQAAVSANVPEAVESTNTVVVGRPPTAPSATPVRPVAPQAMPSFSRPSEPIEIVQGVTFQQITILGNASGGQLPPGHRGTLWLYLPVGSRTEHSLPCVLITGAGSRLIHGMSLGEGDRPEHIPWAQAGFAVVAFELDGPWPEDQNQNESSVRQAIKAFLDAQAGLTNASVAIEFALTQVPAINPRRLYAVGHSSAATLALVFAEHEPRLAGCVAFAPAVDVAAHSPPESQRQIALAVPGADQLFTRYSPLTNELSINCPLFLFYAGDDEARFSTQIPQFAARLKAAGKQVTLSSVPTGGHYESMVNQGIPLAIKWVQSL